MDFYASVILEFCDIRQPFPVRSFCRKVSVQDVFSNELRIFSMPGASIVGVLDRRLDSFLPADSQYTLVVYLDPMITLQIIPDSSVAFIRSLRVDLFNLICNTFVFCVISGNAPVKPFVVSGTAYMPQIAQ